MRIAHLLGLAAALGLCGCPYLGTVKGHPPEDAGVDSATAVDGSLDAAADAEGPVHLDGGTADSGLEPDAALNADACTASTWYADKDGDGFGNPSDSTEACTHPSGYVDNANDQDPHCGRENIPSAGCTPDSVRCASSGGERETCVEDAAFPGCTDWNASASCDASAPVCSGDGECGKCSHDSDCSGFAQVCNTTTGSCVQCTPATEVAQCPDPNLGDGVKAPACDPKTNTCSGQPRESVSGCEACTNDSECVTGQRCVPTNFNGLPHGSYCLLIAPDSPELCPNQTAAKRTASSVLGVNDQYCFPNDTFTTCEAVAGFKDGCTLDAECGVDGLNDGLCKDNACTYGCDGARDCSGSTSMINKCIGALGAKYCDPN